MTTHHDASLCHVQQVTESHAIHLRELQRHLGDLNNRGQCHNLRVRLPESIEPSHLPQTVVTFFNDLLERPQDAPIEMECIHRALRPRGKDLDPPRDVVCCLVKFPLQEKILRKACNRNQLQYQGTEVKIVQVLSNITLQCIQ